MNRLDDLHKEYSAIFPGLRDVTNAFANNKPELRFSEAEDIVRQIMSSPTLTPEVQQEFAILGGPHDLLRALYGIGFIGIHDKASSTFIFCHDGHNPDREITRDDALLVHPCYWMSLNLARNVLDPAEAEDIHDEYDITVKETSAELRQKKLNQLITALDNIKMGPDHQSSFEGWCNKAISTVFAGGLRNMELCARPGSSTCRNLVALNLGRTPTWNRVYEDYGARQVVFWIENAEGVGQDVYDEAARRLAPDSNGRVVFLITRDDSIEMHKGQDLDWVRNIYQNKGVVVIKLSGPFLAKLLAKLRSPQKHDVVEDGLGKVLDTYSRHYLGYLKVKAAFGGKEDEGKREELVVSVDVPAAECYGELAIEGGGKPVLRLLLDKKGPGKPNELCDPVPLKNQAYGLLEAGLVNARQRYIEEKRAQAIADGSVGSLGDCEPPDNHKFTVFWTQDDLALTLYQREGFSKLKPKEKKAMKSAMHRLRRLVHFSGDDCDLISPPDELGTRHAMIRLRLHNSAQA